MHDKRAPEVEASTPGQSREEWSTKEQTSPAVRRNPKMAEKGGAAKGELQDGKPRCEEGKDEEGGHRETTAPVPATKRVTLTMRAQPDTTPSHTYNTSPKANHHETLQPASNRGEHNQKTHGQLQQPHRPYLEQIWPGKINPALRQQEKHDLDRRTQTPGH
jgi:hypothetical protein